MAEYLNACHQRTRANSFAASTEESTVQLVYDNDMSSLGDICHPSNPAFLMSSWTMMTDAGYNRRIEKFKVPAKGLQ